MYGSFLPDWRKEKVEYENKKMCRVQGKSRARRDQNHIILFTSPKLNVHGANHDIYSHADQGRGHGN